MGRVYPLRGLSRLTGSCAADAHFAVGALTWTRERAAAALFVVACLSCKAVMDYASSGLENPLSYLLVTLFAVTLRQVAEGGEGQRRALLLASLAFVNRADTLLAYLPSIGWLALRARAARRFGAGPNMTIIDVVGLTDPFLARLPACNVSRPEYWKSGHFYRELPAGYLASRVRGGNLIEDPALAAYYARVDRVVRGPLLDGKRLSDILVLNLSERAAPVPKPAGDDCRKRVWAAREVLAELQRGGAR